MWGLYNYVDDDDDDYYDVADYDVVTTFFLHIQIVYPANHKQLIHILFAKDFN